MAGFFNKIKGSSGGQSAKDAAAKKNAEPPLEVTPLEKMLQNAGPLRQDGSDRFFGFENFGNTCYCNSIVQALFYSDLFRENVIQYPALSPVDTPNENQPRVEVTIRPPMRQDPEQEEKAKALNGGKKHPTPNGLPGQNGQPIRPEDKPDTPEYKKKQAMLKGPILELAQGNPLPYGMNESTFTALKDVFLALIESKTRTGVLSPQRFLEIFKRQNEYFQTSMHQDAHEFYGLVLNDVINSVEENAEKMREREEAAKGDASLVQSVENALGSTVMRNMHGARSPGTGWVHEIFEGVLTSETTCLTCETASQRDETFIDLSIDLEEHSSVTSCLRKFSREEMLCEKNKFHCDHCGGLQEAEKRMMIKRLPKILTLHLKRFKYTEDYSRLQKLFHRVVYPSYLRMFTTTEDAVDPDRLYELYAVVVHIGGNAYHGHYVSIIKTKDRGWLLFDDEMVEPVDKNFVKNFFGDKPGMATAYVLFYQETTFEEARANQEQDGLEEVVLMDQAANVARDDDEKLETTPLRRQATQPTSPLHEHEDFSGLAHAHTAPDVHLAPIATAATTPPVPAMPSSITREKTKDELKKEKKEREAAEKAEKKAAKQAEKDRKEREAEQHKQARIEQWKHIQGHKKEQEELAKALEASKETAAEEEASRTNTGESSSPMGTLDRAKRGSKSMSKKSFGLFNRDRSASGSVIPNGNGDASDSKDKDKDKPSGFGRLSMGLGRKKSTNILS